MIVAARGMGELGISCDLVLCSPYLRCRQTARIAIARLRPRPPVRYLPSLTPGSAPAELIQHLMKLPPASTLMLVGHEPGLSSLASLFLAGPGAELAWVFKKGSLCRIDFPGTPQPGTGHLIYFLSPRILRRLGARPS